MTMGKKHFSEVANGSPISGDGSLNQLSGGKTTNEGNLRKWELFSGNGGRNNAKINIDRKLKWQCEIYGNDEKQSLFRTVPGLIEIAPKMNSPR
jgi:hypothetical protein